MVMDVFFVCFFQSQNKYTHTGQDPVTDPLFAYTSISDILEQNNNNNNLFFKVYNFLSKSVITRNSLR